eukprot:gene4649-3351_t
MFRIVALEHCFESASSSPTPNSAPSDLRKQKRQHEEDTNNFYVSPPTFFGSQTNKQASNYKAKDSEKIYHIIIIIIIFLSFGGSSFLFVCSVLPASEHDVVRLKRLTRVFPGIPLGRFTPQVGSASSLNGFTANADVKILAVLSSVHPPVIRPNDTAAPPFAQQHGSTSPSPPPEEERGAGRSTPPESSGVAMAGQRRPRDAYDENPNSDDPTSGMNLDSSVMTGGAFKYRGVEVPNSEAEGGTQQIRARCVGPSSADRTPTPKRSIYVRVQYGQSMIETLPLELMRGRHPQVLIDYLLGGSMWC